MTVIPLWCWALLFVSLGAVLSPRGWSALALMFMAVGYVLLGSWMMLDVTAREASRLQWHWQMLVKCVEDGGAPVVAAPKERSVPMFVRCDGLETIGEADQAPRAPAGSPADATAGSN